MLQQLVQSTIDRKVAEFHAHELPKFNFDKVSVDSSRNERLKRAIDNAVVRNDKGRQLKMLELPDSDRIRTLAGDIKQHTLDYLDYYLIQFTANVEKRGGQVHFASDGEHAKQIILDIVSSASVKRIIKSKSMVSEEIELAHVMEAAGLDVVETDLGEFIVQIDHDKPSHIVTPIIHKDKESIAKLFSEYFGTPYNDDPEALTAQARVYLRDKFRKADLGMTGGNFLVAETGDVVTVENEGNARQSMTTPRVLISLVGIEKLVPRMLDLSVMLKLLARSATGQTMTIYSSVFGGTRSAGETDGPEAAHVVLIDNGRTEILASEEYRETLRCIRCGACLNACPIYRKIGGHSYGSVYPGPIGALITPLMQGLEQYKDLPNASSLCGACYEACPVKINIPKHLINLRRDVVKREINHPVERLIYRAYAWAMGRPWRYRLASWGQKTTLRLIGHKGFVRRLPFPGGGWTQVRDMPEPAKKTFRQLWQNKK
ncbi:MAG: iron-sulfur cluster-binding protein [Burkholderiales bacterium]|nr:iron-sulfur cluster-binding protein [Phycisphaerae bacterium]